MICKKCNKTRLRNKKDLCVNCQIEEDISKIVPEISNEQKGKLLEIMWKWSQKAWNDGANEAANGISSRI